MHLIFIFFHYTVQYLVAKWKNSTFQSCTFTLSQTYTVLVCKVKWFPVCENTPHHRFYTTDVLAIFKKCFKVLKKMPQALRLFSSSRSFIKLSVESKDSRTTTHQTKKSWRGVGKCLQWQSLLQKVNFGAVFVSRVQKYRRARNREKTFTRQKTLYVVAILKSGKFREFL